MSSCHPASANNVKKLSAEIRSAIWTQRDSNASAVEVFVHGSMLPFTRIVESHCIHAEQKICVLLHGVYTNTKYMFSGQQAIYTKFVCF